MASVTQTRQSFLARLSTQRLMIAVVFVLIFALAMRIPVDTDTWWHLRSGNYILTQHSIPLTDPFSFTRLGQPWIDHSWGSQIILYGVYILFGGHGQPGDTGNIGLALYTALLATGGMVFVFLMCPGNVYLRAFVVVWAAAAAAVFWSARPQMMSFILSTVVLYVVYLYKWRKVDRLWLLIPIMILWVNLHAGFFIGFLILAGAIAGEVLGRLFNPDSPDVLSWQQIGKLLLMTVLAFAALVINPNTVQMWMYSFRTIGIGVLQQYIQEWASPDIHGRETWPFVFMLLGLIAAVGLGSKRIDWTDLVLICGWGFLALYAGRNISTFAVVGAPVLARHLDGWLKERGMFLARSRLPRGIFLILNWTLLLAVILGASIKIALTLAPPIVAKAQNDYLPVQAADYLNQARPSGPMFNSYNWGGYLMFAAPQYPVFVDGRTDLYDDTLLTQWREAEVGHNWQQTFAQWNIRLAVIEKDSPLADALRQDSGWKQVHTDNLAAIFVRQPS